MTENENVIKALEWLVFNFPKRKNPKDDADKLFNCINVYCQNAIDIINRQKTEIDILIRKKDSLQDEVAEQKAEIERLTNKCEDCAGCSAWKCDCSNIRAYAIEEFAERLKDIYRNDKRYDRPNAHTLVDVLFDNIDNTLKELTEKGGAEQ